MCHGLPVAGWGRPSKQETSIQCCFIAGTPSATLAQHKSSIGSAHRVNNPASHLVNFTDRDNINILTIMKYSHIYFQSVVHVYFGGAHRDREVACSVSDLQGLNFESCFLRAVSSHYPQEVLLAQFSLYVHKSGLKPDSSLYVYFGMAD